MPVCQHVCLCLGVRPLCGPGVSVCERAYRECFGIPAFSTSPLIGLQRHTGLAGRLTSWSCFWAHTPLTSTTATGCCYPIQPPRNHQSSLRNLYGCHMLRSNMATFASPTVPPSESASPFLCLLANQSSVKTQAVNSLHLQQTNPSQLLYTSDCLVDDCLVSPPHPKLVVSKPWNPTEKNTGGEWRRGAAGLCRWHDSETAMWWQGPGIWRLCVCAPQRWWTQTGSRGDTPSKSGRILCSTLSTMDPACHRSLSLNLPVFQWQFSCRSPCFQRQPSSEAVLIYPIPQKQAAKDQASWGLRKASHWKIKWITWKTIRHGVLSIVLSGLRFRFIEQTPPIN